MKYLILIALLFGCQNKTCPAPARPKTVSAWNQCVSTIDNAILRIPPNTLAVIVIKRLHVRRILRKEDVLEYFYAVETENCGPNPVLETN